MKYKANRKSREPLPRSIAVNPGTTNTEKITILEKRLVKLEAKELKALQAEQDYVKAHLWEFLVEFRWQKKLNLAVRRSLIALAPAPNKIGKTAYVVCLIMSWLRGYEAWNEVTVDYPGAVKAPNKKYYKPSSLGKKPPVRIRLSGEEWNVHIGETIQTEIEKWFPLKDFKRKNNTDGVTSLWTDTVTGSTLEMLTHNMKSGQFESWFGDAWIPDEPPKHEHFKSMSRGLFGKEGKIVIPTTPLKEPWILDVLIRGNRRDTIVLGDLCCLDNEMFYEDDSNVLSEMGLTGKVTKHWDEADGQKKRFFDMLMRWELYYDEDDEDEHGRRKVSAECLTRRNIPEDLGEIAEEFLIENTPEEKHLLIIKLKFLKFIKDMDVESKSSRCFGMFRELVGLVVKEFKKRKHVIHMDYDIPANWVVTFQIDFHLSKPQAILFFAVSDRNITYVIDEVWENLSPEEIASLIIKKKRANGWNLTSGEIDDLAKGDTKYMNNRFANVDSSFNIIKNLLRKDGISLRGANKDKVSGYTNIKTWLKGPNKIPILYFSDQLQSFKDGKYGIINEIERLCYDDKDEIQKVNDHFMECLYRHTVSGTKYVEAQDYMQVFRQAVRSYNGDGGRGGWMY